MTLFFGFAPRETESLQLYKVNDDGGLDEAAPETLRDNDSITLFLPPNDGAYYVVEVPPGRLKDLERAAAFKLEEKLATPADDVFISLGKAFTAKETNFRPAYVTDIAILEALQTHEDLADYAWQLVSPFSLLKSGEAVAFEDCAIFHDGERRFALEYDLPDDLKTHVLSKFLTHDDPKVHGVRLANALRRDPVSATTDLQWCATRMSEQPTNATDLRQGPFAPPRFAFVDLNAFKTIAAALCVVAAGFLGLQALEVRAASQTADSLETQITKVAAQIAPNRPPPATASDARSLRPRISTTVQADGLDMLSDVYAAFDGMEGVAIEEATFSRASGRLQAVLIYAEFGLDTRIKDSLSEKYKVTLGDTRSRGGLVTGNLILEVG